MWLYVLQALGSRAVYQGESYIVLLVNALHVHFYSSAWQYLLYFVADSNKNRPRAGGFRLEGSEPSAVVPLLLPRHQNVVFWELYPCKYFTGVSDAELTDKTAPLPFTAGNNGACDQMTACHAGHKELFSPLFFLIHDHASEECFYSYAAALMWCCSFHPPPRCCSARHGIPAAAATPQLLQLLQHPTTLFSKLVSTRSSSKKYRTSVSQVLCPYPVLPIVPPASV